MTPSIDSVLYDRFTNWYISKKKIKNLDKGKLTKSDETVFKSIFFLAPKLILIPIMFIFFKFIFITYYYKKFGFEQTVIYMFIIFICMQEFIKIITNWMKEQH